MKRSDAVALARFVGRYFHATGGRGKLAEDFIRNVSDRKTPDVVLKWPVAAKDMPNMGFSTRDFLGPEWRPTQDPTPRPQHYHVNERHSYWVKLSCGHNRILQQYTSPQIGLGTSCTVNGCWHTKATIIAVEGIGQPPVGRDSNGIFYELKVLLDKGDWITAHNLVCDIVETIQRSTRVFK